MEKIAILDFGSQYTQLIARRLREKNVFSQIYDPDHFDMDLEIKGIILSGGPSSATPEKVGLNPQIMSGKIPVLGICYGMQLMNVFSEGTVNPQKLGEYGKQTIRLDLSSPLFKDLKSKESVWMSHGDSITRLAENYRAVAKSADDLVAAIQHTSLPFYGLQFHPEVTHTDKGSHLLDNFIRICRCPKNWTSEEALEKIKEEIRNTVQGGRIVSLVSGGVDSTVATYLCFEALGPEKVIPIHIDSGLMRKNESAEVVSSLRAHGMKHLDFIDAKQEFLAALKGVSFPEKKRQIIGDLFMTILDREMQKLDAFDKTTFLCQGTLYTDLIESGKGCGKNAAVIKSHHNVNCPFVHQKRDQGLIIEPNKEMFKDEVRLLGKALGISSDLLERHPFPGPGLAIRILGEVTSSKLETLKECDAIYIEEIKKAGLYNKIWQAFAVLLPVSTVGVMGDKRTEGSAVALRAVASTDGMTADFYDMPHEILSRISTRIINEVPRVNRVVYDITSKPPGTIEWE